MRFFHLADLHFGKSIHGVSLLDNGDQGHWVTEFLKLAEEKKPDAVVIAGDVYDRSAPSGEAVQLLSRMLTALAEREIPVMLVAGNHDSAQRLAFLRQILARQGLHISGSLAESPILSHVSLEDEFGPVTFWLMPYVYPALVAQSLGEESLRDNDQAVRRLLEVQPVDFGQRNVIIAHQFVTADGREGIRGGSESMVGGVGQIDYRAFDGFDYVALGHIHAAYAVGRDTVRYAGSPLCYHFDELRQAKKGPVLVELGPKGQVSTETLVIPPLHPMRELRGGLEELQAQEIAQVRTGEYLRLVLTDRRMSPEIGAFFEDLCRARGSVLMERCSEYSPFGGQAAAVSARAVEQKSLPELFAEFYAARSGGSEPGEAEMDLLEKAGKLMREKDLREGPEPREIEALLDFVLEQEGRA